MTEYRLSDPFKEAITKGAYWVTTTSQGGKFVVLGPFQAESEATGYAYKHFGDNFDVEYLPTRDQARATRILKKKRFDSIHDLDKALERASHKAPERER